MIQLSHSTAPASLNDGLSGATRVYFIVGDPIAQVRSPQGVTAALRQAGLDALVVPAHVAPDDLAGFFTGITSMRNVDGVIITVPHKFSSAAFCASFTPDASFLGAVNTLRRRADGLWHAGMFDGLGLVAALADTGGELKGRRALLAGAGGAGSAIALALVGAGIASLDVLDSDASRTSTLVARLATLDMGDVRPAPAHVAAGAFDIVVNATPMGMRADDPLPIDVSRLDSATIVGDVVTRPSLTPLIQAARTRGCKVVTGTQMFERVCDHMVAFFLDTNR